MKKLIFMLCLCCLVAGASAQTPTKTEKIKQLLDMSGSSKVGAQVIQQLLVAYRQAYTNVDAKFWDDFAKELTPEDLINLIIPIYDKYYTEEDIDQLISFYNSPVGKKMTTVLPQITKESMEAGEAWGKKIGEKVVKKLKKNGYLEHEK